MSGTPPVSDFKRQVQASTQVPAWGKTNKPPPQLAVPQSFGSGGSSPASSSIALPGQKKKKAKADIVYSQPADTGTGRNQGTQMALLLDFLKKCQNPIRLEDLVIQTGVAALETDQVFREKFEAAEGVQKNPINGTYSFKRVYHARTPEELLKEIHLRGRDGGGLSVKHLKEGFPDVNNHITELEKQGRVLVIRTDKDEPKQVFWNEITPEQGGKPVDDEFRSLWDSLKNPVEADLLKALEKEGLQPTASEAVPAKPTKKKDKKAKAGNRNVKIQNTHITNIDLRKDFSADKKFGQS
ncbi:hypothetical protein FRC01_001756 [Tulasnella sp. 417]|nr:hypothetical protein FRC01_001756 [Tulasnella sp. 417]